MFVTFLHCNVILFIFSLFRIGCFKGSHYVQSTLEWTSLGKEHLHNILEFFCMGDWSLLPLLFFYLIIYLCHCGPWIFILYFGLSWNTSLFYCSDCPSFSYWELGSCVLLKYFCHCGFFFFSTFLLFGTIRWSCSFFILLVQV